MLVSFLICIRVASFTSRTDQAAEHDPDVQPWGVQQNTSGIKAPLAETWIEQS
jgi:hypothetical protein